MPIRNGALLRGEDMKNAQIISVFIALAVISLTACGGQVEAAEPVPLEQPSQEPTLTSIPPTTAPVESPVIEPTQSQYAPFCEAATANGCQAPAVTMIDPKYCVDKVPYVIISVPPSTTFETSDPDLDCNGEMHNDGSLRIACHSLSGKDEWSYDLKLCNGACSAPVLQMETGQCPDGYGYDPTGMCCAAPAPASGDGCTTFTVDLRVCYGE